MRKLAAIALLAIFTFNMVGYQLVYNYMSNRSDKALELALDNKLYSDSELISIKQPTNLPYYTNNRNFQRIDGEVEIQGVQYKYVKCRIYNDTLEMLCIPNTAKMQIEQSRNDYAKVAHDFQQDGKEKKSESNQKSIQKQASEYEELTFSVGNNQQIIARQPHTALNTLIESQRYYSKAEQPPDAAPVS